MQEDLVSGDAGSYAAFRLPEKLQLIDFSKRRSALSIPPLRDAPKVSRTWIVKVSGTREPAVLSFNDTDTLNPANFVPLGLEERFRVIVLARKVRGFPLQAVVSEGAVFARERNLIDEFHAIQRTDLLRRHPPADEDLVPRPRVVVLRAGVENNVCRVQYLFSDLAVHVVGEIEVVVDVAAVLNDAVHEHHLLEMLGLVVERDLLEQEPQCSRCLGRRALTHRLEADVLP